METRPLTIVHSDLGLLEGRPIKPLALAMSEWDAVFSVAECPDAVVAGGSVARALLGLSGRGADTDLFVPADQFEAVCARFRKVGVDMGMVGSRQVEGEGAGNARRFITSGRMATRRFHQDVDVISCESPFDALARFDIRAACVATDGRSLWFVEGAMFDLQHRRLVPLRETSARRLRKYHGMGLDLWGCPDVDNALANNAIDVPGWKTTREMTREERLGDDLEIEWRLAG